MTKSKNKWKRIAFFFIAVSLLLTVITGILFVKCGYANRIATKFGIGGGIIQTVERLI